MDKPPHEIGVFTQIIAVLITVLSAFWAFIFKNSQTNRNNIAEIQKKTYSIDTRTEKTDMNVSNIEKTMLRIEKTLDGRIERIENAINRHFNNRNSDR